MFPIPSITSVEDFLDFIARLDGGADPYRDQIHDALRDGTLEARAETATRWEDILKRRWARLKRMRSPYGRKRPQKRGRPLYCDRIVAARARVLAALEVAEREAAVWRVALFIVEKAEAGNWFPGGSS